MPIVSEDQPRVPVRSKSLLDAWVEEFLEQGLSSSVRIDVAVQDGADGRDTGLVVVRPQNADADVYMQPKGFDQSEWETTLLTRSGEQNLSPHHLAGLAAELTIAGNLCAFLQFKSLQWDRMSGMH